MPEPKELTGDVQATNCNKRQKTDPLRDTNSLNQEIYKCNFIKPKNNKRCGLQVRKGQKYCFAHINLVNGKDSSEPSSVSEVESVITRTNKKGEVIKRVRCTVDPSHTVWENHLSKHVKICNVAKMKKEIEEKKKTCPWFRINYNVNDTKEEDGKVSNNDINYEKWKNLIQKWTSKHDILFPDELPLNNIEFKDGLEERFAELSNQKHIRQQSSLIGQLFENKLVVKDADPGIVIEFGCGRAEFTRYFNKAIGKVQEHSGKSLAKYLLVDRENPRLKFDKKIISDSEEIGLTGVKVERLKVDIKDLKLVEILKDFQISNNTDFDREMSYIGISKHLCGVATDLTLRCLVNTQKDSESEKNRFKFGGCLVAMCCRHCCKYNWLLNESKQYLQDNFGIDESNFFYFKKMFAWATNGVNPKMSKTEAGDHFTGLSIEEREIIGLKMRRILDESRKYAMGQRGFQVKIVRYVDRDVSLENNCIIIKNCK